MIDHVVRAKASQRFHIFVALAVSIVGLLAGCVSAVPAKTAHSTVTPIADTPTVTAAALLPAFSDWRAAYMGQDGVLHVVTLDGKTDVRGPRLFFASPGQPTFGGGGIVNAGFSPDGHFLAYGSISLNIIDIITGKPISIPESIHSVPRSMAWSSDGQYAAFSESNGEFNLAKASDGSITTIPGTPLPSSLSEGNDLDGWLDATHLIIDGFVPTTDPQSKATFQIFSLNITTGEHRIITQIQLPLKEIQGFVVSPDGTKALFYTLPFQNNPFQPYAALIDTASGKLTPLPRIAQLEATSTITNLAWKAGTPIVAISTGFIVNGDLKNWLIDLSQDRATQLPAVGYPIAWSPDERTIIWSSAEQVDASIGGGPFTLTAETFGAGGNMSQTVLTTQAMNFNFIGFLRTASGG